jgi:EAL domain-containing protein (putative c-di-GMP-specific phosphodiesterase class I)
MKTEALSAQTLDAALAAGVFEPAYQPIARLSDGALAGFEALARWRVDGETVLDPSHFLSAAIDHGRLGAISKTVLTRACADMAAWRGAGAQGLFLSANVAGPDLEQDEIVESVATALGAVNLAPELLRLEVTETQILRDPVGAARRLGALRAMGVRIAFDDFGAGYSSLTWLMRLPVDTIKFDSSLIADIARDGPERKILRAMITLAHDLGLDTVGEGVEEDVQREILSDLGCDYAQGRLFSMPLDRRQAAVLITSLA